MTQIKVTNRHYQDTVKQWRIDEDGFLRVTACILKEGVYPYGAEESPRVPELQGLNPVMEFIPARSFSTAEALKSVEGKDVVISAHEWRDAANSLKDGLTVGNAAGSAWMGDDGISLMVDFLIKDEQAIKDVTSGALVEVSAGYETALAVGHGDYNGQPYHAEQTDIRFNHVLLLPPGGGRCGHDVRITNQQTKDKVMENSFWIRIKQRLGNKGKEKTFKFNSEEDAKTAENMLDEQTAVSGAEIEELLGRNKELADQLAQLQAEKAEVDSKLAAIQAELDAALSPDTQAAVAGEIAAQTADEEAIIEDEEIGNADGEDGKEKALNSLRQIKTMEGRRKEVVRLVMENSGAKVPEDWKQEQYDGAFKVMAFNAKAAARAEGKRILHGADNKQQTGNAAKSRRERVYASYKKN